MHGTRLVWAVFAAPAASCECPTPSLPPGAPGPLCLALPDHCATRLLQLFIGFGFPYEGPAPLEAIANGCVFLQSRFSPPHSSLNHEFFRGKPTSREVSGKALPHERVDGRPCISWRRETGAQGEGRDGTDGWGPPQPGLARQAEGEASCPCALARSSPSIPTRRTSLASPTCGPSTTTTRTSLRQPSRPS